MVPISYHSFIRFSQVKSDLFMLCFFLKTQRLNIRGSCLKIFLSLRMWDLKPQFLKVFPKFFKFTCWKIIIIQHVYTARCQRHYRQNHKTVNLKSKERGIKKVWHERATFARISKWRLKEIRCQRHYRQPEPRNWKPEIEKWETKRARCQRLYRQNPETPHTL
jgi:hypothetical protein